VKLLKSSLIDAQIQASELKKSNSGLKEELVKLKETVKKYEADESSAVANLEVLKKASERFIDRVKDVVKLPVVVPVVNKGKDLKIKDVIKKEKIEPTNDVPMES
jgi:hypothetical protein